MSRRNPEKETKKKPPAQEPNKPPLSTLVFHHSDAPSASPPSPESEQEADEEQSTLMQQRGGISAKEGVHVVPGASSEALEADGLKTLMFGAGKAKPAAVAQEPPAEDAAGLQTLMIGPPAPSGGPKPSPRIPPPPKEGAHVVHGASPAVPPALAPGEPLKTLMIGPAEVSGPAPATTSGRPGARDEALEPMPLIERLPGFKAGKGETPPGTLPPFEHSSPSEASRELVDQAPGCPELKVEAEEIPAALEAPGPAWQPQSEPEARWVGDEAGIQEAELAALPDAGQRTEDAGAAATLRYQESKQPAPAPAAESEGPPAPRAPGKRAAPQPTVVEALEEIGDTLVDRTAGREAAAAPALRARVVSLGADRSSVHELITPQVTIGREPGNDLMLKDRLSSKHHARLVLREDGYWLQDLDSRNGSFVNGVVVTERLLRSGDVLRFGATQYRYELLSADGRVLPPEGSWRGVVLMAGLLLFILGCGAVVVLKVLDYL